MRWESTVPEIKIPAMVLKLFLLIITIAYFSINGFPQTESVPVATIEKNDLVQVLGDDHCLHLFTIVIENIYEGQARFISNDEDFTLLRVNKDGSLPGRTVIKVCAKNNIPAFRNFLESNRISIISVDSVKFKTSNLLSQDEITEKMKVVFDVPRMEGNNEPVKKNTEEYFFWKIYVHEKRLFMLMNNYYESLIKGEIDRQQTIIEHWKSLLKISQSGQTQQLKQ
ncbi:MAG: hypothetical protein ABIJ16_02700 [Bacteroidota bacterium]